MAKIIISKEKNFPVDLDDIKAVLSDFFKEKKVDNHFEVSVAIVDKQKMIRLAEEYLNEKDVVHNVLSFTSSESENFKEPKENPTLGEIVICYPKVKEEAKEEGVTIQEKIVELAVHGGYHLLGIHHE